MVFASVVDAAVIIYMLSNELVACTKTRSFANNAPAGVAVQFANPSVEEAASVTFPNEQYPKTIPLMVGAAGSSPTIRAEVLAVPIILTISVIAAPIAIVPSVALVIVSPLSKVKIVVVAPPRKVDKPVKLDTPETVNAPVSAIVPSVALVMISPLRSVKVVVVAPPARVANPSALIAPAAEIVKPESPKPPPT